MVLTIARMPVVFVYLLNSVNVFPVDEDLDIMSQQLGRAELEGLFRDHQLSGLASKQTVEFYRRKGYEC